MYLLRKATTKPQGLKGAFIRMLTNEYVRKNKLMHDNKIGISLPNEYNRLPFSINERIQMFLCSILAFIFVMSIFNIRK